MMPSDFIEVAGQLAVTSSWGPSEARYRSAVSRAYYGAFHSVCTMLRDWNIPVRRNSYGHQDALDALRTSPESLPRSVASLLDHLRSERIRADYRLEDGRSPSQQDAMTIVETANRLLILIEKCLAAADSIRSSIVSSDSAEPD